MEEAPSHTFGGRRAGIALLVAVSSIAAVVLLAWAATAARGQSATTRLDAQREQIRQMEAGLAAVDAEASGATAAYQQADARVRELRQRITQNIVDQATAKRRFERQRALLEKRLLRIYGQGTPSPVEMLVSAGSFTDAVDGVDLLRRVQDRDADVVRATIAEKKRLDHLGRQLIADRAEAVTTRKELASRMRALQALAAQRQRMLANARASLLALEAAERRRQQAAAAAAAAQQAAAVGRAEDQAGAVADGSAPVAAPASTPAASAPSSSPPSDHLQRIAACESGGDPRAVSASGQYRGKYQFDQATWQSVGGSGDPAAAPEAEQDQRAAMLYQRSGAAPWPVCGAR